MKLRPVGAELFHMDGQTDRWMTKLVVAFRNFRSTPKNFGFVYQFGMKIKHMTNVQKPYL